VALVSNLEVLLNCSTVSPLEMMDVHSYHNCVRLTLRWKHKHCKQVKSRHEQFGGMQMQISLRLIESLRKLTGIDYYQDMMPTWLLWVLDTQAERFIAMNQLLMCLERVQY